MEFILLTLLSLYVTGGRDSTCEIAMANKCAFRAEIKRDLSDIKIEFLNCDPLNKNELYEYFTKYMDH